MSFELDGAPAGTGRRAPLTNCSRCALDQDFGHRFAVFVDDTPRDDAARRQGDVDAVSALTLADRERTGSGVGTRLLVSHLHVAALARLNRLRSGQLREFVLPVAVGGRCALFADAWSIEPDSRAAKRPTGVGGDNVSANSRRARRRRCSLIARRQLARRRSAGALVCNRRRGAVPPFHDRRLRRRESGAARQDEELIAKADDDVITDACGALRW